MQLVFGVKLEIQTRVKYKQGVQNFVFVTLTQHLLGRNDEKKESGIWKSGEKK